MCEGLSSISGPIPPDPSFCPELYSRPASARGRLEGNHGGVLAPDPGPGCHSARAPARAPRINSNAAHILQRGQRGVVGELLKLDGVSITPVPQQKKHVRDFGKENVRRLREIQRRCKEQDVVKAQAGPVPVKALWISPKYQHVPSRVTAQLQVAGPAVKPQCQNFLRGHSGASIKPPAVSERRPASGCSTQEQKELQRRLQTVDFIRYNARAAGKTALHRSQSLSSLRDRPLPSAVKGQVPPYLKERKRQWRKEEEERRRSAPDPAVPPGHSLMAEPERRETLRTLKETHRSLVTELLSLPLRADTLSVRSRRAHLDCRLSEIEEAIKIFSRDKVYIKNDS